MRKKVLATTLVVALVAVFSIGATLAYMTAKTEKVENTFVAGEIGELSLQEKKDGSLLSEDEKFIIVPGVAITKDPKVTFTYNVEKGDINRPAYVFVTVTDESWTLGEDKETFTSAGVSGSTEGIADDVTEKAMSWVIANGWTYLLTDGEDHVFYQVVDPAAFAEGTKGLDNVSIIKDDQISVDAEKVTEANIGTLADAVSGLSFKAYAIQQEAIADVETAWDLVKGGNQ